MISSARLIGFSPKPIEIQSNFRAGQQEESLEHLRTAYDRANEDFFASST